MKKEVFSEISLKIAEREKIKGNISHNIYEKTLRKIFEIVLEKALEENDKDSFEYLFQRENF